MQQFNATSRLIKLILGGPKHYAEKSMAEKAFADGVVLMHNFKNLVLRLGQPEGQEQDQLETEAEQQKTRQLASDAMIRSDLYTAASYIVRPLAIIMLPFAITFDILAAPFIALKNFFAPQSQPQLSVYTESNTPVKQEDLPASVVLDPLSPTMTTSFDGNRAAQSMSADIDANPPSPISRNRHLI